MFNLKVPSAWKTTAASTLDEKKRREKEAEKANELKNHYTPNAVDSPSDKESAGGSTHNKIEARINMSAEVAGAGLCPACNKPMKRSIAAGIPVNVCLSDRVALPLPDEQSAV